MKLNMILGKKQIILASLVLVLGVAIYLNYTFSESGNGYDITASANSETTTDDGLMARPSSPAPRRTNILPPPV